MRYRAQVTWAGLRGGSWVPGRSFNRKWSPSSRSSCSRLCARGGAGCWGRRRTAPGSSFLLLPWIRPQPPAGRRPLVETSEPAGPRPHVYSTPGEQATTPGSKIPSNNSCNHSVAVLQLFIISHDLLQHSIDADSEVMKETLVFLKKWKQILTPFLKDPNPEWVCGPSAGRFREDVSSFLICWVQPPPVIKDASDLQRLSQPAVHTNI